MAGPCAFSFSGLTGVSARIGAYNTGAPNTVNGNWYGFVGSVRVYNRALPLGDVQTLFTNQAQ